MPESVTAYLCNICGKLHLSVEEALKCEAKCNKCTICIHGKWCTYGDRCYYPHWESFQPKYLTPYWKETHV